MPKKTADQWFAEYGESHQHHTNELIHWVCVPAIFWSLLGLIWTIPVPDAWVERAPWFTWALVAIVVLTLFYVWLSPALSAGMLFFMSMCYTLIAVLDQFAPWPMRWISIGVFVVAWIGQFIGHQIEGKKPAFLQDIVFLLIGPAWLMSRLYKKIGQKY